MKDLAAKFAELGVATVHEAFGRSGVIDLDLRQIVHGSRVAGPARTALCEPADNTMVHAIVARAQPGDILVLTSSVPAPVALVGELLATQAKVRDVAGILVDGAVRDLDQLEQLRIPIWARYVRPTGASKGKVGQIDVPIVVGGVVIRPQDLIIMDCDGAMVVPAERVDEVMELALTRAARENELRDRYLAGELSIDIQNLRHLIDAHNSKNGPRE